MQTSTKILPRSDTYVIGKIENNLRHSYNLLDIYHTKRILLNRIGIYIFSLRHFGNAYYTLYAPHNIIYIYIVRKTQHIGTLIDYLRRRLYIFIFHYFIERCNGWYLE